jgi:hypothetical protein
MAKKPGKAGHPPQYRRSDRPEDDPYRDRGKRKGHIVCSCCGAEHLNGRWRWAESNSTREHGEFCPACRRIRDRVPAGQLVLRGTYLNDRKDDIMRLVRNVARRERMAHPMKRIMKIINEEDVGALTILCTDTHLPRDLGQSIKNAFGGELEISYGDRAGIVRVVWSR